MKSKEIAYIIWEDPTWHSDKNIQDDWNLIKQITCGLVVKEDKKYIRIALNIDETKYGEYIDIPKSLIVYEKRRNI